MTDRLQRPPVCVIGAGLSGLTAIKKISDRGLEVVCYELGTAVGGNWRFDNDNGRSPVYASLRIDTSKERFSFADYPVPSDRPVYLHHSEVLEYLEGYARRFDLEHRIRFSHKVTSVVPDGTDWMVETVDTMTGLTTTKRFSAVVVASGHHWKPNMPDLGNRFEGRIIHAQQYRVPEEFESEHVVVVGLGNTGADIATELVGHASSVTLSTRSGAHILPRYVLGRPLDSLSSRMSSRLPLTIQRAAYAAVLGVAGRSQGRSGIPFPDAPLLSQHPTVSEHLIDLAADGKVDIVRDVTAVGENRVEFVGNASAPADTIICATGYDVSFPFLDESLLAVSRNDVGLFEMVVPVGVTGLYFVGLIQPVGALPPLAEQQARWVAQLIDGAPLPPKEKMLQAIDRQTAQRSRQYLDRPRHTIQVDYWPYLDRMRKLCDANDRRRGG